MSARDTESFPAAARALWVSALLAALLVLLWTRTLNPLWMYAGAITILATAGLAWRTPAASAAGRASLVAGLVFTGAALAVCGFAQQRFRHIQFDWDRVVREREQQLGTRLDRRMSVVAQRGRLAAERAAAMAETDSVAPFEALATVRASMDIDALMLFTSSGDLVAWDGDHRGTIPDVIRRGGRPLYAERPLYSYLYFPAPVKGRALHAVSAVLLETGTPPRPGEPAARRTVAARTNVPAQFRSGPGHGPDVAWSLVIDGDSVVHARLERTSQAEMRASVAATARRAAVLLALVALALIAAGWLEVARAVGSRRWTMLPLLVAPIAFVLTPWGPVLDLERLLSPGLFLPPTSGEPSLGELMSVVVPMTALAATLHAPRVTARSWVVALGGAALLLAVAYMLAIRLALSAATQSLLLTPSALWLGLQPLIVIGLTTVTALLLPRRRDAEVTGPAMTSVPAVVAGLMVAALLAVLVGARLEEGFGANPWMAMLWAIPFAGLAWGFARSGPGARWARWLASGALAASAVLPQLWGAHVGARITSAEREIRTFGEETPPIVDYLLIEFAREAMTRYAAGEDGLQLLYRSWVASGLAQEPYAARIGYWSTTGRLEVELPVGGAPRGTDASLALAGLVREAAADTTPQVSTVNGLPEVSRLLTVPLDHEHLATVTVAPRRTLQREGVLTPFLGVPALSDATVRLVQPTSGVRPATAIEWIPSDEGWRSEALVQYPDGPYHAHVNVRITPVGMRMTRAALLVALDLTLLLGLFMIGFIARGRPVMPRGSVRTWFGTFRSRVTLALFVFFLLPTLVFGSLALGAVASIVERAAGVVAEHAARQAVAEWEQVNFDLRELSFRTGTDVLYYLGGELTQVSSPEALELGLYGAWLLPDVYSRLRSGEQQVDQDITRVGSDSYLTAYHIVYPSGTLAAPVALSTGDAAARQREVRDLIVLAAIIGGVLSLVLSFAVGRALAGPIGRLRRAAAVVGAGRLGVRLPEPPGGEFGELFASFNSMTRRLRRARAQEVRTARVLAWGEMARQVAHEIKNPLTPIKLAVQHLRRAYRDRQADFGVTLDENVDQILHEIDRLTEISRAFSRYGAPQADAGPLRDVDIAAVVREALALYRAGESRIRFEDEIDAGLPPGRARATELHEVLLNLLENARQAVEDGGRILVRAHPVGRRVRVEVVDNGVGIPPGLMPRIFDPHFSIGSGGTGLGLAIVRRIVESWDGTIEAESEIGAGTTLRFWIHAAEDGKPAS
ncbi:MAG: HAMP domain-containing histidine kinase [Gemmatimonadetes bacterium]|nr:HAMP domain-containing histidine kinase [Gemmatimonadota bacterium]